MRTNIIGLSCLVAASLATGCSEQSELSRADVAQISADAVRAKYASNTPDVNGPKLNGPKMNGPKMNGTRLNGTNLNTVGSVSAHDGALVGFEIETGAVLSGPNFSPTK